MRVVVLLPLCAVALCGCGEAPAKTVHAAPSGPPPVSVRWIAQRDMDLEGQLENRSDRPLDNLLIEATVEKLEKAPDGAPLTGTTSATVVYERPPTEHRILSGTGKERTYHSAGGPDVTVPPGKRGSFRLASANKHLVRRIEVFRRPPGVERHGWEVLAAFQGAAIK